MRIVIVTPAPPSSRAGNRTTALRWAGLLAQLGHSVTVATAWDGADCDAMIAIHAWRSAASIERFAAARLDRPLVVLLAGTDVYRFLESHREMVLRSLDRADAIVGLHDLVGDALEPRHRAKLSIVYQSAVAPSGTRTEPDPEAFEILVVGHLRAEKDPLRAAFAARLLPASSRVVVEHLGRAHDADWARRAEAEMAGNPRYRWRGEVDAAAVAGAMRRAQAMVLSSVMEGGANVVSEAIVAGLPVLASAIPGSIGLLGRDWPGYYPVEDTQALAALVARVETEPPFLHDLGARAAARAPLFSPERERDGLAAVLARAAAR